MSIGSENSDIPNKYLVAKRNVAGDVSVEINNSDEDIHMYFQSESKEENLEDKLNFCLAPLKT